MHVVRPPKSLRLVIVLIWERLAGFSDNPGFGVRGSRCGVRDTGFGLRDLGCGIRDSGFAIRDSGCEIDSTDRSDLSCKRVRPHPISNPQSPIPNPQSAIRNPQSKNPPNGSSPSGGLIAGRTVRVRLMVLEVQEPPAVIPFQRDLTPAQRYLRIRIERADVRPGRGRILLWISQRRVVWIGRVTRPCVTG